MREYLLPSGTADSRPWRHVKVGGFFVAEDRLRKIGRELLCLPPNSEERIRRIELRVLDGSDPPVFAEKTVFVPREVVTVAAGEYEPIHPALPEPVYDMMLQARGIPPLPRQPGTEVPQRESVERVYFQKASDSGSSSISLRAAAVVYRQPEEGPSPSNQEVVLFTTLTQKPPQSDLFAHFDSSATYRDWVEKFVHNGAVDDVDKTMELLEKGSTQVTRMNQLTIVRTTLVTPVEN